SCTSLEKLNPQPDCGLVVCNPPYGLRLAPKAFTGFYAQLGAELTRAFLAWSKALVCPNTGLAQSTGLDLRQLAELDNGGLSVGLFLSQTK
ncbi:MAG: RNA methyltransferase, partial [Desulfuromonas sp.]